ncbi:MAG: GAF domain-containing protein [Oscillatoriales cyanobacterium]|nr:MAG: GAF domain-containing protein [Oscillatoriales cyanobacterium]
MSRLYAHRSPAYFQVGGSLSPTAQSYVSRWADRDLAAAIVAGEFCYIFDAPQTGKTSLQQRVAQQLREEQGYRCMFLDLTRLRGREIDRQQWYMGIARLLLRGLDLDLDFRAWIEERSFLPPVQYPCELLEDVALRQIEQPIVIFIDDIEVVLDLMFRVDDFFALLRSYQRHPQLRFVVAGCTTAIELVRDLRCTPFETGKAIRLARFQMKRRSLDPTASMDLAPLINGLWDSVYDPYETLSIVLNWTGGQPFLTQWLCQLIVERAAADSRWPPPTVPQIWVAHLVQSQLVTDWETHDRAHHLGGIRDRLLQHENALEILKLYSQVLQTGRIAMSDDLLASIGRSSGIASSRTLSISPVTALCLMGLTFQQDQELKICNRIYSRVFDVRWLQRAIVSVQPDCIQVINRQEQRLLELLQVMENKPFDEVLHEILSPVALKLMETLHVDRVTLFIMDAHQSEIWSIVARGRGVSKPEVNISGDRDDMVGQLRDQLHTPFYYNSFEEPIEYSQGAEAGENPLAIEGAPGRYFNYSILVLPLIDANHRVVGVIRLANRLRTAHDPSLPLRERIDPAGFSASEEMECYEYAPALCRLVDRVYSSYRLTQRLRASEALAQATRSLSHSRLDADEIVMRVMAAAKTLMNADRTTLWILDETKQRLWTKIPREDGTPLELTLNIGEGYAGQVAQTGQSISIPFDLYDRSGSEIAKQTDRQTGYRTCSLLCMPVRNPDGETIAVTQLINRRKTGDFPAYDPTRWPEAPEVFRASFDAQSENYMRIFNDQVGVALQNAQQYADAKQRAALHSDSVVGETLAMLDRLMDSQGFDEVLDTTLRSIAFRIGRTLNADRTSIFMLDEERQEFWSILAESNGFLDGNGFESINSTDSTDSGDSSSPLQSSSRLEIRTPLNRGIVGEAAATRRVISIPFDFYDDPRSVIARQEDRRNHYRTATVLAIPLLDRNGELIAVVQFLNKLRSDISAAAPLMERLDRQGFTRLDIDRFERDAPMMRAILESFRSYHKVHPDNYAAAALLDATRRVSLAPTAATEATDQASESNRSDDADQQFNALLVRIMGAAKTLMNADRSTLWLLDTERQQLWTKVQFSDGTRRELRIPIGAGYAGRVATTGEPLIIPFDLYDDPGSETARRTDRQTGYRTCSLLCAPVYSPDGDLLGVTQLVNKLKPNSPKQLLTYELPVPDGFRTSFDESDLRLIDIFNNQAGAALQNSALIHAFKRQEQSLRDTISPNFSTNSSESSGV